MHVMVQTCADESAYQHYQNTILREVNIGVLASDLDEKNLTLLENMGLKKFPVWGMEPSNGKVNHQWAKLEVNDYVMFYRKKGFISYGHIVTKFHNKHLADKLWGTTVKNTTWEYMYVMRDLVHISIPASKILEIVNYHKDFFQGAVTFNEELSLKICEYYDLATGMENMDFQEFEEITKLDMKETDRKASIYTRKEQAQLRDYLFKKKKYNKCAVCGRVFTEEFLVTAHLKKRSLCTLEERIDIDNIVVPMCTFGCDSLYEKGYLGIHDGHVIKLNNSSVQEAHNYIEQQVGKECSYYKKSNSIYCESHNEMFVRKEKLDEIYNKKGN